MLIFKLEPLKTYKCLCQYRLFHVNLNVDLQTLTWNNGGTIDQGEGFIILQYYIHVKNINLQIRCYYINKCDKNKLDMIDTRVHKIILVSALFEVVL